MSSFLGPAVIQLNVDWLVFTPSQGKKQILHPCYSCLYTPYCCVLAGDISSSSSRYSFPHPPFNIRCCTGWSSSISWWALQTDPDSHHWIQRYLCKTFFLYCIADLGLQHVQNRLCVMLIVHMRDRQAWKWESCGSLNTGMDSAQNSHSKDNNTV